MPVMSKRLAIIVAGLSLAAGGAALAAEDSPIATASPTPPVSSAPLVVPKDPTADQIDAWLKADGSSVQRLDPNEAPSLDVGPRRIHGEVGATYSNRGYSGYGFAAVPLGEASELDVAVAAGHERIPHFGTVNPRSIAVGLYLDGGDVNRWVSGSKCGVPRWGVALPGDPQVREDASCAKKTAAASDDKPFGRHHRGGEPGSIYRTAPVDDEPSPTP